MTAQPARVAPVANIERRLLTATEHRALADQHVPLFDFNPPTPERPVREYAMTCSCGERIMPARSLRVALDNHGAHVGAMETVAIGRKVAEARATAARLAELDRAIEDELMAGYEATAEADAALPRLASVLRFRR